MCACNSYVKSNCQVLLCFKEEMLKQIHLEIQGLNKILSLEVIGE